MIVAFSSFSGLVALAAIFVLVLLSCIADVIYIWKTNTSFSNSLYARWYSCVLYLVTIALIPINPPEYIKENFFIAYKIPSFGHGT